MLVFAICTFFRGYRGSLMCCEVQRVGKDQIMNESRTWCCFAVVVVLQGERPMQEKGTRAAETRVEWAIGQRGGSQNGRSRYKCTIKLQRRCDKSRRQSSIMWEKKTADWARVLPFLENQPREREGARERETCHFLRPEGHTRQHLQPRSLQTPPRETGLWALLPTLSPKTTIAATAKCEKKKRSSETTSLITAAMHTLVHTGANSPTEKNVLYL